MYSAFELSSQIYHRVWTRVRFDEYASVPSNPAWKSLPSGRRHHPALNILKPYLPFARVDPSKSRYQFEVPIFRHRSSFIVSPGMPG